MKKIFSAFLVVVLTLFFSFTFSCKKNNSVNINLKTEHGVLETSVIEATIGEKIELPELYDDDFEHLGWVISGSDKIFFEFTPSKDDKEVELKAFWIDKDPDPEIVEARFIKATLDDYTTNGLTLDDIEVLEDLKTRYAALGDYAKSKVTNIELLDKYLHQAKLLVNVVPVIDEIKALPRIIQKEDSEEVLRVEGLYNELNNEEKELVNNYDKLTKALAKLEAFKKYPTSIATTINEKLLVLPYKLTIDYYDDGQEVLSLYHKLPKEEEILIDFPDYIERLKQDLYELSSLNGVVYHLGKDNYNTREEFGQAWFRDFYKFIYTHGGIDKLEDEGIYNVDQFVALAYNYYAGRGEMRYLGDTFSDYYLAKDVNGIIENQPDTHFLGFCYKNNRYKDFIPFLIRFFAYWRLDEHYASLRNYGADSFADRWATLVDTCKFFYFTVDTSYVQTDRMQDCFNNCSGVVNGTLNQPSDGYLSVDNNIKLRDYNFEGWYESPDFAGEKVRWMMYRDLRIDLYAKWSENKTQIDADEANLTDVYIYNLLTERAIVNETTVQYVKDMYDNLSNNAKELVTRKEDLDNLVNKYL